MVFVALGENDVVKGDIVSIVEGNVGYMSYIWFHPDAAVESGAVYGAALVFPLFSKDSFNDVPIKFKGEQRTFVSAPYRLFENDVDMLLPEAGRKSAEDIASGQFCDRIDSLAVEFCSEVDLDRPWWLSGRCLSELARRLPLWWRVGVNTSWFGPSNVGDPPDAGA